MATQLSTGGAGAYQRAPTLLNPDEEAEDLSWEERTLAKIILRKEVWLPTLDYKLRCNKIKLVDTCTSHTSVWFVRTCSACRLSVAGLICRSSTLHSHCANLSDGMDIVTNPPLSLYEL